MIDWPALWWKVFCWPLWEVFDFKDTYATILFVASSHVSLDKPHYYIVPDLHTSKSLPNMGIISALWNVNIMFVSNYKNARTLVLIMFVFIFLEHTWGTTTSTNNVPWNSVLGVHVSIFKKFLFFFCVVLKNTTLKTGWECYARCKHFKHARHAN